MERVENMKKEKKKELKEERREDKPKKRRKEKEEEGEEVEIESCTAKVFIGGRVVLFLIKPNCIISVKMLEIFKCNRN